MIKRHKISKEDSATAPTVPHPHLVVDKGALSLHDYEGVVRTTLIELGTNDPDAYLRASGDMWKRCRSAGIDAATCGAVMYGSMRHHHEVARTTVKEGAAEESPTREEWEVVVKRGGANAAPIESLAGRQADKITSTNVVFAGFHDDQQAGQLARKMTNAGYVTSSGPARATNLHEATEAAVETRSFRWLRTSSDTYEAPGRRAIYEIGHRYGSYHLIAYRNEGTERVVILHREFVTLDEAKAYALQYDVGGLANEASESSKGDDGAAAAAVTTTTVVAAAEETCKTCIPWQKVSRDGEQHAQFAELRKKFGPIKTPLDVYAVCGADLNNETQEVFLVLPLNIHGELIGPAYEVARGQRDRVAVGIDNVMDAASDARCAGFIVCHQHPSDSPKPSDADIRLTRDIKKAVPPGRTFIDHVIISPGVAYSCGDKRLYKVKS